MRREHSSGVPKDCGKVKIRHSGTPKGSLSVSLFERSGEALDEVTGNFIRDPHSTLECYGWEEERRWETRDEYVELISE